MCAMSHAHTTPISRAEKKRRAAADPRPRQTISWYRYVQLADPEEFRDRLHAALDSFGCLGRIYVAHEGVNAQMNVPLEQWDGFDAWVQNQPELRGVPYKKAVEEADAPSFYKLTMKIRPKIVADGLDDSTFDVTDTGAYLTPEEMNQYIDDPDAVVVDMRNNYESEVGHFTGAVTPDVETFRDELRVVPEQLRVHKSKKIALYCTGGIRCEKASAWLKHNGFTDVRHLKGGIIDYAQAVKAGMVSNKFRGKNFVFDERLGERVSEEVIATCHLCKQTQADTHHHCRNQVCHALYIGCDNYVAARNGYCSRLCALTDKAPTPLKKRFARHYNAWLKKRPFKKVRV